MNSYKKSALAGLSSVAALRIFTQVLVLGRLALIARILSPADFGIFGIVTLVLAVSEVVTETGVGIFLLQQEAKKFSEYLNSAWVISSIRGLLVALVVIASTPFVSSFFSVTNVWLIFLVASLIPLISGITNPAQFLLQKNLQFKKEAILRGSSIAVGSLLMVITTWWLRSPIALVLGLLVETSVYCLFSFIFLQGRPQFKIENEKIKIILKNGKWLTLTGITNYIFHNFDDMVVGRFFGAQSLGLYQMAYKIGMLPISEGADVLSRVTLPIFTKLKRQKDRLIQAFWKISFFTATAGLFAIFIIFLWGEQLIVLLLGENWRSITPIVQALILFGTVRAVTGFTATIFYALEKQKYVSIFTTVSMLGLILSIFPLVSKYGVLGAAYASLVGAVCAAPVMYYYLYKFLFKKTYQSSVEA